MQVKIFSGTNMETLEEEINAWLLEPEVTMHHVTQSETGETEQEYSAVTVSVWYTEA